MLRFFRILFTFLVLEGMFAAFIACDGVDDTSNQSNVNKKAEKEQLENANKYMLAQEKEDINAFIAHNGMDMAETGTGLRYRIVKQGDTAYIKTGDIVSMDYDVSLLTGELMYSSKESGRKVFLVGKGGVESGLEEAVLHLHNGDEAEIIIPSHLAYGLLGDGERIPPRAALFYRLKIIDNLTNK